MDLEAWATDQRRRVYPTTLAAVLVMGFVVSQFIGPGRMDAGGIIIGADFSAFYVAGEHIRSGQPLYDIEAYRTRQQELSGDPQATFTHAHLNPPVLALVVAPLSLLSYDAALAAWWCLTLAAFAWASRFLRTFADAPRQLFAIATFYPVLATIFCGQTTGFSFLIWAAAAAALHQQREHVAGAWVGILAYKPQLAVPWAIVFLVQRRWRALFTALGVALVITALTWALAPRALNEFLAAAHDIGRHTTDVAAWGQHSILHASRMLFGATWGWGIGVVGTLAWLIWCFLIARHNEALALGLALFALPHLFFYDLALLLVPFAMLGLSSSKRQIAVIGYVVAFASSYLAKFQLDALGFAVQLTIPAAAYAGVRLSRE